jgi:hypothetical protein
MRWLAASAAALAVALASLSLLLLQRHQHSTELELAALRTQLDEQIAAEGARREELAARVGSFEAALSAQPAQAHELALSGEASFGEAKARVVMDAAGQQVLLLASRLPPLPPGRTYQLWVIVSGAPKSLGVFAPDRDGRVVYVESEPLVLEQGVQAAISVEPAGGVPQPTGPIVLISH